MSKMGNLRRWRPTTPAPHCAPHGPIGISQQVLDEYFTGELPTGRHRSRTTSPTTSRPATRWRTWTGPDEWAAPRTRRSAASISAPRGRSTTCSTRDTVCQAADATRSGQYSIFKEYTALGPTTRARRWRRCAVLPQIKDGVQPPVPLDEVEAAGEIVKRFSTVR